MRWVGKRQFCRILILKEMATIMMKIGTNYGRLGKITINPAFLYDGGQEWEWSARVRDAANLNLQGVLLHSRWSWDDIAWKIGIWKDFFGITTTPLPPSHKAHLECQQWAIYFLNWKWPFGKFPKKNINFCASFNFSSE